MKVIYVHGLDSSANSMKGVLLETYCQKLYPDIEVIRPDLNEPAYKVFNRLCNYVTNKFETQNELNHNNHTNKVILVGSSLGGYFSSLVSNHTGCRALLLNPSIEPHVSLKRFINDNELDIYPDNLSTVIYRTTGGWEVTLEDLEWFSNNTINRINYPDRLYALIKEGDELLDPIKSMSLYESQGVKVNLQPGGNHRMTDFESQLPLVISVLKNLANN